MDNHDNGPAVVAADSAGDGPTADVIAAADFPESGVSGDDLVHATVITAANDMADSSPSHNSIIDITDSSQNSRCDDAVTFQQFMPLPSGRSEHPRKQRKVALAELITASPYKQNLETATVELANKEEKKMKKRKIKSYAVEKPRNVKCVQKQKKLSAANDVTPCHAWGQRFCDDKSGRK